MGEGDGEPWLEMGGACWDLMVERQRRECKELRGKEASWTIEGGIQRLRRKAYLILSLGKVWEALEEQEFCIPLPNILSAKKRI